MPMRLLDEPMAKLVQEAVRHASYEAGDSYYSAVDAQDEHNGHLLTRVMWLSHARAEFSALARDAENVRRYCLLLAGELSDED